MSNFRYYLLATLLGIFNISNAQSCWRNTTCSGPQTAAFPGEWDDNIFAPDSRSVSPKSILDLTTGTNTTYTTPITFNTNGTLFVFDFGIEVGGIVHVNFTSNGTGSLGLAFSEAKNWIGEWSDSSNGGFRGPDGAVYANVTAGSGSYAVPDAQLRGGFRYLTLFWVTEDSSVTVTDITTEIGFQPTWSNLRAYQGYWHSNDEVLNKIWYSGAYTLQTNLVPVNTGRQIPVVIDGWANNGTLGSGDTIIVDGAKRDRAVWPGDMGVAVPSLFVSIGDLESVRNALQVMYDYQDNTTGAFPEAGPPLLQKGSDTYHMWTMVGTYNYVLYTDDTAFLAKNWAKYQFAMNYIYGKVGVSGLLNVTGIRDWARWQQGFNNTEANIILYHTLNTGSSLATWANDTTNLTSLYTTRATALQTAILANCLSPSNIFKDNATNTTLLPQDANSLSLLTSLVPPSSHAEEISEYLTTNWNDIGAVSTELPNTISPFISSLEIQGHLTIGSTQRALDLIRRSWGWYLGNENGTQSTVIEGYLSNGSFAYRQDRGYDYTPSYVSHSHGWSSGPTSVLTEYVLGIRVSGRAGKTWIFEPQFGDLLNVEGGFVTGLGAFSAGWEIVGTGYVATLNSPNGTSGDVRLPWSKGLSVTVDGVLVGNETYGNSTGGRVSLVLGGGSHSITVS